jgi:uncharacterized phiE125 gp8 family phage protein
MIAKRLAETLYEPISVDDVQMHLRIDGDVEYGYIQALITAARRHVEDVCLHTLMPTTWEAQLDTWPNRIFTLPMPPLRSVVSITYVDRAGATDAVNANAYQVDTWSEPGRVTLRSGASWPALTLQENAGVRIRYVAGYADVLTTNSTQVEITAARKAVPALAKHAMKLLIGHLYENREEIVVGQGLTPTQVPMGVNTLLASMRYEAKEF